ncbi:hypothetical protein PVAND_005396 [Polypedilum vanderplanki]|uniref:Uncharacterized protein n=1 Tax=Polypedilum vanderplanki TaxID=319348 RepID=A0A9J6C019_POLVA|nr:hypothetical protein PVAND_005396 [Polypedilum vanderplanki]
MSLKNFKSQSSSTTQQLLIPTIDDTIIANLDNLISKFKDPKFRQSESDLLKSLDDLKNVKSLLQKFNDQIQSSFESSFESIDDIAIRRSIEMIENNGKFLHTIGSDDSIASNENPLCTSSRKSSKILHQWSATSLKNSISVSPCKFNQPTVKKLSPILPPKKTKKKIKKNDEKQSPKIIKTFHATCRIHKYDNNSHTFEVLQPRSVTKSDNDNVPSEIVIVLLANGETALFASKQCSFLDINSRRRQMHGDTQKIFS